MNNFWSSKRSAFCRSDILGDGMPDDAVEVSTADYRALLDGQAEGKLIVSDPDGFPTLEDPPPPSDEQLREGARYWRDQWLAKTDPLIVRHRDQKEAKRATTLTNDQYSALQAWRLDLRDWPALPAFPSAESRPQPPDWISALV
ncbi:phage tail protein [Pseudomonas syringae]|uniref:phage tail protein n=1 Tax=Pseudomonas syringae TaxID=317 RepID=UPI001BCD02C1|nr:phage tail protein [Pseudomonas syringae]MBS7440632.1 phage tail protein [Pseudomonas syringae]